MRDIKVTENVERTQQQAKDAVARAESFFCRASSSAGCDALRKLDVNNHLTATMRLV